MKDTFKCCYQQCKYGNQVKKNEAIKNGSHYFHKECLEEKLAKVEIYNLFIENFPQSVFATVRKGINDMVDKKGIEAKYLLFVLKYSLKKKFNLNHIFGLSYYANNDEVKKAYKKYLTPKVNIDPSMFNLYNKDNFTYVPKEKKEWGKW